MLMHVFAVYDMKAEAYYPPMFQKTVGLALRIFKDMANNPDTTVGRFPTDYALFQIGTYEDTTGILTPLVRRPESIPSLGWPAGSTMETAIGVTLVQA